MNNNEKSAIQLNRDSVTEACWSCGDMRAAQFCRSCGRVQPPAPADYFTFFGLPQKLNIDEKVLERELYALSRKLHPDLYVRSSSQEQSWSLEQSSTLNDAYRTLRDPIERTEYVLRLHGIHVDEQSKLATEQARTSGELKKQMIPPDMLEEVFELNMQLEELRMNKKMGEDSPGLVEQLAQTKSDLQARMDGLMAELKSAWDEWDAVVDRQQSDGADDSERKRLLNKMVDVLNRRSYIRNLIRDVNAVLTE